MTDKHAVNDHDDDPEFDRLIEESSLGTTAARRLRGRVSAAQVEKVRRLAERGEVLHGDSGADVRVGVAKGPAGQREIFVRFKWTQASVIAIFREIVAHALAVDQDAIDVDRPLIEQGLDPMAMIDTRGVIERAFGVPLPPEMIWKQRSTVAQLADYVLAEHSAVLPAQAGHDPNPVAPPASSSPDSQDMLGSTFSKGTGPTSD